MYLLMLGSYNIYTEKDSFGLRTVKFEHDFSNHFLNISTGLCHYLHLHIHLLYKQKWIAEDCTCMTVERLENIKNGRLYEKTNIVVQN